MREYLKSGIAALLLGTMASCPLLANSKTIKIGILTDMSSAYADIAGKGVEVAARLALADSDIEKQGWKVEILSADHQNKADLGMNIARKWYDTEGVDAVLDLTNSAVALAVGELSREKNKVVLGSGPQSSDMTGKACSPNFVHWTSDTWALAHGTAQAMVKRGGDSWFFVTADYAFGHALQRDAAAIVVKEGGKVVGEARAPINTADFASFLLQAQNSRAKVVGLANAGTDTTNAIKQASEFGLMAGGQTVAGMLVYISDVHSLGLEFAKGIVLTEPFYWDLNDGTRAFSKRFGEGLKGRMPTMMQAGAYSATLHYLKTMAEMGPSRDGVAIVAKMKAMPTDDALFGKGRIREDGRKIHYMYLFEVKQPKESKGPWDYYKLLATIPAEEAFRPMKDGGCPLVKQ